MQPDSETLEAFMNGVTADIKGHQTALMASLGDHLGMFRALAGAPATSEELAGRIGLDERHVREWLAGMAAAEYVEYDPERRQFRLTPEQAAVLATDDSPVAMGGTFHELAGLWAVFDRIKRSFRTGDGIDLDEYPDPLWDGMERFTNAAFQTQLIPEWVAKADGVSENLEAGGRVADVGCGRGRALIELLETYPESTGVGYDLSRSQLDGARKLAFEAGIADRVEFHLQDASQGLHGQFDLVMTFDVIHDLVDVDAMFSAIREALTPGGSWLLVDFDVGEKVEENINPVAAILYGFSLAYCLPTSVRHDGDALGSCGLPPSQVRARASSAGFQTVDEIPVENPFNQLYQLS